jgi:hypothetical protein
MTDENSPSSDRDTLEQAVSALRVLAEKRKAPSRHHVRDLLIALGEALLGGAETEAVQAIHALQSITPAFGERWNSVLADELALACTEHVRSVDPRYIHNAQYDFEYTIEARERLELRLRAAERLGSPATPHWSAEVRRADALLAEALKRRAQRERKT